MLDISEGLGVGVVNGGRILEGHSGLGGELGHVTVDVHGKPCGCGNHGCLETVATDTALAAAVSQRLGRKLSIEEVVPLLQSGEVRADEELGQILEYLAVGLAAVVNLFNPSKLFVYGRLLDAGPDLFDRPAGAHAPPRPGAVDGGLRDHPGARQQATGRRRRRSSTG